MAATAAALAVTDELALPLRAVGDLAAAAGVSREEVVVITQCASLGGKLPFDDASVGSVLAVIKKVENLGDLFITEISRVLKAGGMVLIQSSPSDQDPNNSIQRKLLLGGFVDVQASAASSQDSEHSVTIKAKKVSWSMGSSFPLKKATKGLPKIQIDDDSELIDEDSLLTEDDLKKPELPVVGDCEVGATRKACKNCTCGRAEAEEKVEKLNLTSEQINNPQSACGNCGLGDAFRCGTCPYRGLPAFKPGEKIALPGNFLAADFRFGRDSPSPSRLPLPPRLRHATPHLAASPWLLLPSPPLPAAGAPAFAAAVLSLSILFPHADGGAAIRALRRTRVASASTEEPRFGLDSRTPKKIRLMRAEVQS
uniref:Anamorsin homolog n=1 Tax=Oryza nivara TaxID=4536 RepID=A0A0E0H7S1_ORYNI